MGRGTARQRQANMSAETKARVRAQWLALFFPVWAGMILTSCRAQQPSLVLRTDPAPLARRLNLPPSVHAMRWVAVSPVHDSGLVPKNELHDVYAYIPLDDAEWLALEKTAGQPGERGKITIPEAAAELIIPTASFAEFQPSEDGFEAEGPAFRPASLSSDPKTHVQSAIRSGRALIIYMKVN